MNEVLTTVAVLLVFTLIGGFFAAAETALVSLRESQVARLAQTRGEKGRRLADLVANPNRFLAAVQVGVTLAGFLSAGFGASRIVPILAPALNDLGVPARISETLAFIVITLAITYLSLVLGELVPKRVALQRGESVALASVGVINVTSWLARPFIWLVSVSTNALVRLLGLNPAEGRESISGEELRGIVASQESLSLAERELIDDVFAAGDRELSEVMVPRTEVEFLDASMPVFKAARAVVRLPHSRYPVIGESSDDVVGFVHVRDLLDPDRVDRSMRLGDVAREVLRLPDSRRLIPALHQMRMLRAHLAIVVDEYGGTAGIVTMEDLVEELVGEIEDEYDSPALVKLTEADVPGLAHLDEFAERTGITLPEGPYETVAGYVLASLGRLAAVGDVVGAPGARLTVVDMDGLRVAQVHVEPDRLPDEPTDGLTEVRQQEDVT